MLIAGVHVVDGALLRTDPQANPEPDGGGDGAAAPGSRGTTESLGLGGTVLLGQVTVRKEWRGTIGMGLAGEAVDGSHWQDHVVHFRVLGRDSPCMCALCSVRGALCAVLSAVSAPSRRLSRASLAG